MNSKNFFKILLAALAIAAAPSSFLMAAQPSPATRPNIVFILMDDLGWADVGCFGSRLLETPNIDQLAQQGMRFTDAYATSPVCLPSRASLLTGKYPQRFGLTWIHKGVKPMLRKILPASKHTLPLESSTIAEALKTKEYATFFTGKWHLGDEAHEPEFHGFDINIAGHQWGCPNNYFYPYSLASNPRNDIPDLEDGQEGEYLTDRLTDETIQFIEGHHDKPFFVYLSHYAVHAPLQAKKALWAKHRKKLIKHKEELGSLFGKMVSYAAMVESMDDSVGKIMQKLEALNLAENTLVIFTSDNGGFMDNSPLRGIKAHTTEGGIRVPLIVRWPAVVAAGSESDVPVTGNDFFPTLNAVAGIPDDGQHDGLNLLPLLKGEAAGEDRPLFWHTPHFHPIYKAEPAGAVRLGPWKLIHFYEEDRFELYNVVEDKGEKNNLAAQHPERVAELRKRFEEWADEVGALMPREP